MRFLGLLCTTVFSLFTINAYSSNNEVKIHDDGQYRYIESNGIPDHATGAFPNRGNPNSISAQSHRYRMPLNPQKTDRKTDVRIAGIAINGVPMEPGTAEAWNNDRRSGWNIQAFAPGMNLGIDENNAHVQPNGTYHYHALPTGIIDKTSETMVGWAADGFEIHYIGEKAKSSYRLKVGNRNSGPGGRYDGTYEQDWEYVSGLGTLDECNGAELNDKYVYFITDTYPFIQRCVFGIADSSFNQRPSGPPPGGRERSDGQRSGPPDGRRPPPPGHRPPPRH